MVKRVPMTDEFKKWKRENPGLARKLLRSLDEKVGDPFGICELGAKDSSPEVSSPEVLSGKSNLERTYQFVDRILGKYGVSGLYEK